MDRFEITVNTFFFLLLNKILLQGLSECFSFLYIFVDFTFTRMIAYALNFRGKC